MRSACVRVKVLHTVDIDGQTSLLYVKVRSKKISHNVLLSVEVVGHIMTQFNLVERFSN